MALHRLTTITIGVPNVDATAAYYSDFGLTPRAEETFSIYDAELPATNGAPHRFSTADGGEQLRIVPSSRRRVLELGVGADHPDDLARVTVNLTKLGVTIDRGEGYVAATDPGTEVTVRVELAARLDQDPKPAAAANGPGRNDRVGHRADAVLRDNKVRPRKLGHAVLGSTDQETSQRFFTDGIGFKISDRVVGRAAFMRCSTDHHNVLVQAAPIPFLHHTSWQVDDVDEVGRGASAMLEQDPSRHVWGLGRHHIGSNFFWYLRDPAGNFSEYYSDIDCIVDDALWTVQDWDGARGLYNWGPPPPPSFIQPDDLAAMMTGAHTPS